ncbi:MAG: hypothetical protein ACSI46_24500 [Gloeotrichia echinulata DVL01]
MPWPARLNPNLEAARVHSKAWALGSEEEAQDEPQQRSEKIRE